MNRIRRIVITFLVVIAVAGIIHFTSKPVTAKPPVEVAPSTADVPELRPAAPVQSEKRLSVYYLAGKENSNNESFVQEIIAKNFAAEFKSGAIVFKVILADSPEYLQWTQEFKSAVPAVILEKNSSGEPSERKNISLLDFKNKTACAEDIVKAIHALLKK